ncbi:MAG: hypothetical protein OSJ61_08835 [Lachnospiraceae bacterium]|nr:hypothetical protein [Lachnospiraceae bacterium]
MKTIVDEKHSASIKRCAFCKNWYDPTNFAINLLHTSIWEYDPMVSNMCRTKGTKTIAQYTCSKFVSKI